MKPNYLTIAVLAATSAWAGPAAPKIPDYVLHEWGTFTTVSASDGRLLTGLEREEEPLPDFVYSHEGMENSFSWMAMKGWRRPLADVTVRMETPVIYFYTPEPFTARVDVGFHGGSISQWYPQRSGGEIPPKIQRDPQVNRPLEKENTLDFAKKYEGRITWDVQVEPAGDDVAGRVFRGGETPSWLHPRQPASALVRTPQGEEEKYLFYRGLGRLDLPMIISATDQSLKVGNCGEEAINHWLVFDLNDQQQARWSRPAAVAAARHADGKTDPTVTVPLEAQAYRADWQKPLYADAAKMLTAAGLTRSEADAMLQTWWKSYFQRPGLRVFWVVPSGYTEQVLPLTVSPSPKEIVRVLVGRSEILRPSFEQQLVADFAKAGGQEKNRWANDRYFLAYQDRVNELAGRKATAAK